MKPLGVAGNDAPHRCRSPPARTRCAGAPARLARRETPKQQVGVGRYAASDRRGCLRTPRPASCRVSSGSAPSSTNPPPLPPSIAPTGRIIGVRNAKLRQYYVDFPSDPRTYWFEEKDLRGWVVQSKPAKAPEGASGEASQSKKSQQGVKRALEPAEKGSDAC